MIREPIYQALFAKFSAVAGTVTASRRLQHWADVPAVNQPALFQSQGGENAIQQKGLPKKWQLSIRLYLYARSEDPNVSPQTVLNPILDAIEAALDPAPGDTTQTLGIDGISHAWIAGNIETDEGVLGEQAIAIIPIDILTT